MNRLKLDPSIFTREPHPDFTIDVKTKDEFHLSVHSADGTGSFSRFVFHDSVFSIAKNFNKEDFVVEEHIEKPAVWFHFNPVGSILHRIDTTQCTVTRADSSNILLFRHPIEYEIRKNVPNVSLVIIVSPDRFAGMLDECAPVLFRALEKRMCRGNDDNMLIDGSTVTPGVQVVLHDILNAPYRGRMQRLYFEGKVNELIALRLAQMIERDPRDRPRTQSVVLRGDDAERIRAAKEILTGRMDDPPTISHLARLAGINEFKLKRGFRQIFGNTIFGVLREHRLETAMSLIRKREMNIAQIAFEVGYRNPAHFADAFRKRFGVNPGMLLAEKRKPYSI